MKTNRIHSNGTVEFKHAGQGKWQFSHVAADGFSFEYKEFVGGREKAGKVANIVTGAMKRTEGRGLDNLARANITKILG
jgi:hypothetical protein